MGRKERKQEEARILAQMQDALDKVGKEKPKEKSKAYEPMDESKRKKIRLSVGGVGVAVFNVMILIMTL